MPHQRSCFLQADGNYYKDPEKDKMTRIATLGCANPMDTSTMQYKALGKFSEEGAKKVRYWDNLLVHFVKMCLSFLVCLRNLLIGLIKR